MTQEKVDASTNGTLKRVVGVPGAVLLGLGSIVGTGVFVSIGVGAEVVGQGVVLAVALAAIVATCNGLSSAQLAAAHPVSGGTYAYGYRYLNPILGFNAGWMYLCAKSASAATAALGFAGYLLTLLGQPGTGPMATGLAVGAVVVLTALVAGGIRRSTTVNGIIVAMTLLALGAFVVFGAPLATANPQNFQPFFPDDTAGLLNATALMFVAYTGYGRVATLGEEIRDPARNIPRAIVATLVTTMLLYVAVTAVAVGAASAGGLAEATGTASAPLEIVARLFDTPGIDTVVAVGAITAMLGVLLNLLLGLSRVMLAMARKNDLPQPLARVDGNGSPKLAVIATGVVIGGLALIGDIKTTWTFSAFTVLVYYATTNLAALFQPPEQRRYPRVISVVGLAACLGLAFWVDTFAWIAGLALIALGLVVHLVRQRAAT